MKQITALLLILMMLLSLAACGADTPAAEATAAESQTPIQQAESPPPVIRLKFL